MISSLKAPASESVLCYGARRRLGKMSPLDNDELIHSCADADSSFFGFALYGSKVDARMPTRNVLLWRLII